MLSNLTDEKLVELSVSGDPDAFAEIVARWERKMFALCFGMLGREDEAHDALQNTFIAAYRNLANFRGDSKVSSWLHRIAVNQCLSVKRKIKTRAEDLLDEEAGDADRYFVAPADSLPSDSTEKAERLGIVRQAVVSLPPELRQVIVMKEFEEMTFQEIANSLELPLSTVKSRLYTALKQLRMKLERTPIEIV